MKIKLIAVCTALFLLNLCLLGVPIVHAQIVNTPLTLLPSTAQTSTLINSPDQSNLFFNSVQVLINVSAYTSGTYTPHIQGKDPASGSYYDLLVGSAVNSTGFSQPLSVGPGWLALPNVSAQQALPAVWRVQLVGTSTPFMTLSVGAFLTGK